MCAQVSDLEEERRKLRMEVKFKAKYHGKTALEMGLTPEQLLLLEEYVEGLKGGRNPEERLVTQLQQRVSRSSREHLASHHACPQNSHMPI
jgi:centrosomal protein CEP290